MIFFPISQVANLVYPMDTLEDFLCLSDVLDYDKPSSSSDVQSSEYEQFEKELLALDLTNMDDPNVNKFINTLIWDIDAIS